MVKVKICGLRTLETAQAAVSAGADYLGFNFYPPSPRYIEPAAARRIIAVVGERAIPVGVFVGVSVSDVETIAAESGIRIAQLHGGEGLDVARSLSIPSILALRVKGREVLGELDELGDQSGLEAVLLDAYRKWQSGGTGETFDWTIARAAVAAGRWRILLAGGLTPDNVADAVRQVRPWGVDVASGVESAPGVKDPERIRQFIAAARAAAAED